MFFLLACDAATASQNSSPPSPAIHPLFNISGLQYFKNIESINNMHPAICMNVAVKHTVNTQPQSVLPPATLNPGSLVTSASERGNKMRGNLKFYRLSSLNDQGNNWETLEDIL